MRKVFCFVFPCVSRWTRRPAVEDVRECYCFLSGYARTHNDTHSISHFRHVLFSLLHPYTLFFSCCFNLCCCCSVSSFICTGKSISIFYAFFFFEANDYLNTGNTSVWYCCVARFIWREKNRTKKLIKNQMGNIHIFASFFFFFNFSPAVFFIDTRSSNSQKFSVWIQS